MAPGSDPVGQRTHPLTGVVQGTLWAGAAFLGLAGSAFQGDLSGDVSWLLIVPGVIVGAVAVGFGFGFWIWWATRYVIDSTEVRVETGIIWRSSRRIAFERIQAVDVAEPLLARIFGLAELRIDSAGGKESRTSLKFLPLATCQSLRNTLLERAHGRTVDPSVAAEPAVEDLIVRVPPQRLLVGTILTLDFAATVLGTLAVLVGAFVGAALVDGFSAFAVLGGLIPLGSILVQMVAKRIIAEWDFRLTRTPTGLRIERGLLSRTSQTIPFARVQGVAVKEPYLWRRLGWVRLEVDVAGQAASAGSTQDATETTPTLVPIADPALARAILAEVIAEAVPDAEVRTSVPRRSWPFAPIGWKYRWVGADGVAFVARSGWLQRTTDVVPHARTQSVALRQGPLQRRLGVATVEVHTPDGPVDAEGRHLDAQDARTVAFAQLDRARSARA